MTNDAEREAREAELLKLSNAEADEALRRQSIADAITYQEKQPAIEKRRRAQGAANTPEAWAKRNDFDPF